jgi:hypothetical protein
MERTGGATITKSGPKGTVAWMSPERNNIEGPTLKLAPPMDVYSFGIVCRVVSVCSCLRFARFDLVLSGVDSYASLSWYE